MENEKKADKPADETLHAEEAEATDSPAIPTNVSPEKKVFEGKSSNTVSYISANLLWKRGNSAKP